MPSPLNAQTSPSERSTRHAGPPYYHPETGEPAPFGTAWCIDTLDYGNCDICEGTARLGDLEENDLTEQVCSECRKERCEACGTENGRPCHGEDH